MTLALVFSFVWAVGHMLWLRHSLAKSRQFTVAAISALETRRAPRIESKQASTGPYRLSAPADGDGQPDIKAALAQLDGIRRSVAELGAKPGDPSPPRIDDSWLSLYWSRIATGHIAWR